MAQGTATDHELSVRDLAVRYGRNNRALQSVTLTVPPAKVVAVMGVNGAGKTTLARAITGMLRFHGGVADGGEVVWGGRAVAGMQPAAVVRAGISQTLEGRRIFPELTVDQNLVVGGMTRRNDKALKEVAASIYEMFPRLAERKTQQAGYLSGGEQQMLAVGRALMQSPRLMVLDEPSLGLAPSIVGRIRDTILAIRDAGTSVLLIEQNATMALSVSDYGYVLSHGRVTKEGPSAQLLRDPEIQRFYLGLDSDDDGDTPGVHAPDGASSDVDA